MGEDLFLLGILWSSCIWMRISLSRLGKFSTMILFNRFSFTLFLLLSFRHPNNTKTSLLYGNPCVAQAFFILFNSFLFIFVWVIPQPCPPDTCSLVAHWVSLWSLVWIIFQAFHNFLQIKIYFWSTILLSWRCQVSFLLVSCVPTLMPAYVSGIIVWSFPSFLPFLLSSSSPSSC